MPDWTPPTPERRRELVAESKRLMEENRATLARLAALFDGVEAAGGSIPELEAEVDVTRFEVLRELRKHERKNREQ